MAAEPGEGGVSAAQTEISRTPRPGRSSQEPSSTRRGASDQWRGYIPISAARKAVGYVEQLIPNWLPATGVAFLVAHRGDGKTLLLLDQALSFATDCDWLGLPTAPGRFAVYVCGEFPAGTLSHAEAWCEYHNVNPDDMGLFHVRTAIRGSYEALRLRCLGQYLKGQLPQRAKPVIYIDTWQRVTATGDQIKDTEMQEAVRNAEYIGSELSGPVIAAAHPPEREKVRRQFMGSSVIENSSVAIWQMRRIAPKNFVDLRRMVLVRRNKSGGEGEQIAVKIVAVEIPGPKNFDKPLTGAVIVRDQLNGQKALTKVEPISTTVDPEEAALLLSMRADPCLSFVKRAKALGWQGLPISPMQVTSKTKLKDLKGAA